MSVSCTDKFKRHRGRTAKGIKIAAGSAETTFTTERNNFNITAKFATVKSVPIVIITAMKHFVNILKDGITNNDTAICNSIKMIVKNSLHDIHKYILQQNLHKNQPHPSRMRGRGAEVCLSALFYWQGSRRYVLFPKDSNYCTKILYFARRIYFSINKVILPTNS